MQRVFIYILSFTLSYPTLKIFNVFPHILKPFSFSLITSTVKVPPHPHELSYYLDVRQNCNLTILESTFILLESY